MFYDEEREFAFDIWYLRHQFEAQEGNMDYVQNSIVHDVDEAAISMATPGAEGAEPVQGPRKISPRPWLMAPKNLAMSRVVALPVTAVTAAALLFYSRDSISAGAARFEGMRREDSQDSVRKFMHNAKSNLSDKFSTTRFPSSSSSFAQLHVTNPSWDRL